MRIDPAELRKKNLIRPDAFPYETRTGWVYDTGNYAAAAGPSCQALADWDGYAARHARSEAAGKYPAAAASSTMSTIPACSMSAWKLRFRPQW